MEAHKALKPGNVELLSELDEWMEAFDQEEERRKAEALAAMADEGWTVVQRHKASRQLGLWHLFGTAAALPRAESRLPGVEPHTQTDMQTHANTHAALPRPPARRAARRTSARPA